MMVPEFPTPTNIVELSVVVVVDLLLLQEMMVKLKRRMERMMSICFTKFPIRGLGEPNLVCFSVPSQCFGNIESYFRQSTLLPALYI